METGALELLPIDLILWILVVVVFVAYAIYSAILYWHWKEYSTGKYTTTANMIMYLAVSACFFVCMVGGALWYSLA